MVIKIKDYSDNCYTNADGGVVFLLLKDLLSENNNITVSFEGIQNLSSSFVNSALIQLLDYFEFDYIKNHLSFIKTTKVINDLIIKRFNFEVKNKKPRDIPPCIKSNGNGYCGRDNLAYSI